jgi:hypothetical protein
MLSLTQTIPCALRASQESSFILVSSPHIIASCYSTTNHTFLSGTLENGEARLMFSSAHVEYVRYWLHAMGLTKELIPLPYSDCLLTSSRLQNHSPVVYKTGTELRNALKVWSLFFDNGLPARMIRD